MKKNVRRILSVLLSALMVLAIALPVSAVAQSRFSQQAYATIVTASDFQRYTNEAFNRFAKMLYLAKTDGMPAPDSVLIGGDYTMVLNDNAVPGISKIRGAVLTEYPQVNPESIVCIQGNHDRPMPELAKTGFYDMGAYNLYVINEDDFPWKQASQSDAGVKKLASDVDAALKDRISANDLRPVIVLTHVPLHHTTRNNGGDNLYSSYLFDVLNKNAETLDIIYLFGHNHSHPLDDYIGGSVNFLAPGDTIRIPIAEQLSASVYAEETLNFTYTNCGYVGYSKNGVSETSTNVLTMGIIELTETEIHFLRYTADGFYGATKIQRKNADTTVHSPAGYPELVDRCWCHSDNSLKRSLFEAFIVVCRLFGLNTFCTCGDLHI